MTTSAKIRTTLQDISLHARVSTATASRVLNGNGYVSEETKRRVIEAIQELRYPKRAGQLNLVGLILPDASNPFFSQLAFGFERSLEHHHVHLLVSSSEGRAERELELFQMFTDLQAKGLIYITSGNSSDVLLSMLAGGSMPVVAFDRPVHAGAIDSVTVNSRSGSQHAVDYLVAYGHIRIGYLKGLSGTLPAKERFDSFREAMARNGLETNDAWVYPGDFTAQAGRSCAERLLSPEAAELPTAILAANDLMAIGLTQRLLEAGWELPDRLSVIGFDDIEWSKWTYPPLTTISQPVEEMIRKACQLLLRRIEGGRAAHPGPQTVVVEPQLVPRASVAAPWQPSPGLRVVPSQHPDRASDGVYGEDRDV